MEVERQIEAEKTAAAIAGTIQAVPTNLIGLGVIASALFSLVPFAWASAVVVLRLLSIGLTHLNAHSIRRAIRTGAGRTRAFRTFLFSTAFGGFTWAGVIYPLTPADLATLPAVAIVIVMTMAVSMITLTFAPIPKAMPVFLGSFLLCLCAYLVWYFAAVGPVPAIVVGFLVSAVFIFGRRVAQSAYDTARTKVENVRLNRELQDALAEARRLSEIDPLTGIANRRAFERDAERFRDFPASLPRHVLLIDLDHFKRVNDELGHAAGDELLCRVAAVLTATVVAKGRDVNLTARLGGEEFVLVLTGHEPEQVDETAERLRSDIADLGAERRFSCPVSASIGIAEWRADEAVHDALSRADHAMYEAKSGGRDRVCIAA